ncbi:MAG: GNAT family N-acetyltransferase, partial [Betaproteobacteria bacterium]|nr:GNAT family N-acetyltransferase [Betaproteobacteria bacterium]
MNLRQPESLSPDHLVNSFACGAPVLDEWLRRRALGNQTSGGSR